MSRRLILASASPRRREILAVLGLPFEVIHAGVDETFAPGAPPRLEAERLAREKAAAVCCLAPCPALILTADTVVVTERAGAPAILAKPADAEEARRMLFLLSGDTHTVYTGVALAAWGEDGSYSCDAEVVETRVQFRELTAEMIDAYIATGEPFDKAGGYGIQGYASAFVEAVYGDYFNVVGLPIQTVCRMLERAGVEWWRGPEAL